MILQAVKVLCKRGTKERLYSAIVSEEGMVEYKVGEWVVPQNDCGPLAVFVNLRAARCFMDTQELYSDDYVIYRCRCIISTRISFWIKTDSRYYRPIASRDRYPPGTMFAKRVKITKEVYPND
jgi:hypothetical protein